MGRENADWHPDAALLAAFLMGAGFVLAAYMPVLAPLADGNLQFASGDLNAHYGTDSAAIKAEWTFYTFDNGSNRAETNRFYPLAAVSALSNWLAFSESQFLSALIVLCIVLGCAGICLLAKHFIADWRYCAAAAFGFILFYFMNLWSVERLCHIWIWYTYAVFPLLLALGFMYLKDGRKSRLAAYSLVMAFFGFAPHSLIYLLFFHAFLALYSALIGRGLRQTIMFAALPIAAYALINLPPLTIGSSVQDTITSGVSQSGAYLLSKNGELQNLFAFSNNWWYLVPKAMIFSNPAFSWSSTLIFALAFLLFGFAYARLEDGNRKAALLALIAILAIIFVAQGTKNKVIAQTIVDIAKTDFSFLLRPFREWARVSILIPVLLISVIAPCMNDKGLRKAAISCMFLLLAANLAFSPSWAYLSGVHAAMRGIDDFQALGGIVNQEAKTIWPDTSDARFQTWTASGNNISTSTVPKRLSSAGEGYYSSAVREYEGRTWIKSAPRPFMEALNIRNVISTDYRSVSLAYPWMECARLSHLAVCHDNRASAPFRIYDGAIAAVPGAMEPLYHIMMEDYAPTYENVSFASYRALLSGRQGVPSGQDGIAVYEAETGFMGKKTRSMNPLASNGTSADFKQNLSTLFYAPGDGAYGIVLFGNGSFIVDAGDSQIQLNASDMQPAMSGPVSLGKGLAGITISKQGKRGTLDAMLVYPMQGNGTPGPFAIGTPPPARITYSEKVDPTRWRLNITAERPFLLSFAETYDRRWLADVYKDGQKVAELAPIEIYGAIAGYYVNETGDLEVRLRYGPQDMFERTMPLSAAAIAACFGLLAYFVHEEGGRDG